MKTCSARKKDGRKCTAPAGPGGLCAFHDPRKAKARAAGRKAGGKHRRVASVARFPSTLTGPADVRDLLEAVVLDLSKHENSIGRARAMISASTAALEAWRVGSFEDRLAAIEKTLEAKQ